MKLIFGFIAIYIVIMLLAYFFQRSLIYLPNHEKPLPKDWGMSDVQEITLTTADGLHLTAWYKPPQNNKPTILYFQGNAGHIGSRAVVVRPYIEKGYGLLLLGYRGYGGNPGKPSERGLYLDALTAWNFLQKQNVHCIVLFGESLGSGVAIELARRYPVAAVVLLAPYTSMTEIGSYHYPYLPVSFLLKDRYDSASKIAEIKSPLLILIAENDEIIPTSFSKRLYKLANEPKEILTFHDVSHNELHTLVQNKVIDFIEQHRVCEKKI